MTDQPPPAPGGYPTPPGGGSQPPQPPQGFSSEQSPLEASPADAYTPWFTRVLAWLIDYIPVLLVLGIGWAILLGTRETVCLTEVSEYDLGEICATGASTLGQIAALFVAPLIVLVYTVWNYGHRQGNTGSSIGKSILHFRVVSEKTGQPIGFGMSIVRQLAHCIDALICYIGFLFPLWDNKRQTIADKLVGTVCRPL
ncbi:RDD family protein [Mycolicibacterium phlei]|jgi:uncharacterized RDD family membrane protein YckC